MFNHVRSSLCFATAGLVVIAASIATGCNDPDKGSSDTTDAGDAPGSGGTTGAGGSSTTGTGGTTSTGGTVGSGGSAIVSNDGGSAGTPDAGGSDAGSTPATVVGNVGRVISMSVDDHFVYYAVDGDPGLYKAPKDGSGSPTTLFTSTGSVGSVAIDATRIYWTEGFIGGDSAQGAVRSCPLAGCPATPQTLSSGDAMPGAIVVDDQYVYWNDDGTHQIFRVKKDGSVGGGTLFDAGGSGVLPFYQFGHMAVDSTTLYFTSNGMGGANAGGTWVCPVAGCAGAAPTNIGGPAANSIALDATHVFSTGGGSTRQSLKDGTSPLVLDAVHDGASLATDGVKVYWGSTFGVYACAVGGCAEPTAVAVTASAARAIAVDDAYVYWADPGVAYPPSPSAIIRLPK